MKKLKLLSIIVVVTAMIGCEKTELKEFNKIDIKKNSIKQSPSNQTNNQVKVTGGGDKARCDWQLVMSGSSGGTGSGTGITPTPPMECKVPFGKSCNCSAGAIKIPLEIFQLYFDNVNSNEDIYNLDINSNIEFINYLQKLGY